MNTKHTPGPWKLKNSDTNTVLVIQDQDENCIAEVPKYGAGFVSVGNAAPWHNAAQNAALIAAAPDLLEALRFILGENHQVTNSECRRVAAEAIRKAVGVK